MSKLTFHHIETVQPVIDYLTANLRQALTTNKKVLWLVPGGSSIKIAAAVSQQLVGLPLDQLTVSLTDERYGEINHPDSNWRQLAEHNFALPGARLLPVLTGKSRDETVTDYANQLDINLQKADYRLGFFGIGADGHTAGILPNSPAVASNELVCGYDAGKFERITMTPLAIHQLDEAVVYGVGQEKWPIFDQLETELPIAQQPAQILKQVPTLTIFNDYKGN